MIAGAGIVGLSLALDLAAHGLRITVCERGRAMNEASWAAAGMLAGDDPELDHRFAQLVRLSLSVYPEFLADVKRLSGLSVPLRTSVFLQGLQTKANGQLALSDAELRSLAPGLNAVNRYWIRRDGHSIDPRDLCKALPIAARAAGVKLIEENPVASVTAVNEDELRIQTASTSIVAAHFVNCAGAWSASFSSTSATVADADFSFRSSIFPRKGQMLTVLDPGPDRLACVVRASEIYLVPRGDGRIAIGATVEDAGFDKSVEPNAIALLQRAAAEIYPPVASAEIVETWAGLRPASPDGLPLIGNSEACGHHPHCWIATGHFRNGILLAPGTARVLSQAIRGEAPELDLSPFNPSRLSIQSQVYSTALAYP